MQGPLVQKRVKEKLALWGGTAVLAMAILGTIAARPFRRIARRAGSAWAGHGRAQRPAPPRAAAAPPGRDGRAP